MGTFCDIQSDSSICMNQRRQPLKIKACRVILRKLELSQQNLPRGMKPRESSDDSKSPPASLNPCLREEMASSSTCIDRFSTESAEDDWYFQLTGAYDGTLDKGKEDNGNKLRNKNKEPKETQDGSPVNKKADDNPGIDTASEKASVKPDECTREERIRKLKVLQEQQEKAVTNIQVRSERAPLDIFQSLSGEEMMTSAFTDGRCVQKNSALGHVQVNGVLTTKNRTNGSSRVEALVSRKKKKCDAGVQVELYAQLPQERRMITEQGGLKDEETQIEKGGLDSSSEVKNGESTLASIKVEHGRNGVIFSIEQLQGRKQRKVGVKVKSVKERGKAKSLEKVKTISMSGTIQDRSKGFVGSGSRQQGKKRHALDVNAKGRSSQPSGGGCKRKKGSGSKKSLAVGDSRRDEIEQLMKKEQRSCEEFMIILGLQCVNKVS